MTCHYPDPVSSFDWLRQIFLAVRPIRSTIQICVLTRHRYGISAVFPQTLFRMENLWCCREISTIWFLDYADFYVSVKWNEFAKRGEISNRGQKIDFWDHFRVSGKLPTYPSPKPSFCPKWEVSVNVSLGEGVGGQFPRNLNWSDFCTLMYEGSSSFSWYSIVDVILGRTYPLDCSQRISNLTFQELLTFLLVNLLH